MKPRTHIEITICVVVIVMILASSGYLYHNNILETLGEIVVYLMGSSILFGLLLYCYVKITSRSLFDPLDIPEEIPED